MEEPLLSEEGIRILQGSFTPTLFREVVGEELRLALIADLTEQSPDNVLLLHGDVVDGRVHGISVALVGCFGQLLNAPTKRRVASKPPTDAQFAILGPSWISYRMSRRNFFFL